MSENQKRTLTDAELVCNIMLGFLSFPKFALVTDRAMYERLNIRFDVTQERVSEMLQLMSNQWLIGVVRTKKENQPEVSGYKSSVIETSVGEGAFEWLNKIGGISEFQIFLSHNHSVTLDEL